MKLFRTLTFPDLTKAQAYQLEQKLEDALARARKRKARSLRAKRRADTKATLRRNKGGLIA